MDGPEESGYACPQCGSFNIIGVQHEYATGVESDGYVERRSYVGFKCLDCGAEEEL